MSKAKAVILVCFVVAFAAGVLLGSVLGRRTVPPVEPTPAEGGRRHRGPSLSEQLQLTPEQREQMKEMWEAMAQAGRRNRERRMELQRERDRAVKDLYTEEQLTEYERVVQEYETQIEELNEQRRKGFEDVRERTRAILTPEQRQKYDEMLERFERPGPRGPGRRSGTGPPPGPGPAGPPRARDGGGPAMNGPRHKGSGPGGDEDA